MKGINLIFLSLLIISFFLSLVYGQVYVPFDKIFSLHGVYKTVILDIKFPTTLSTLLIGICLSISGAIMQLLLRNPLMDPYISGTASGGAFGAVLAYYLLAFNLPFSWIIYISPVIAFMFSLIATGLTVLIGRKTGVYGIIVGGVVISYIFSSLITVMITEMSIRFPQVPPLIFWLLGSIQIVGYTDVVILSLLALGLVLVSLRYSRKIDLVSISDEMAYSKRIDPNKFRVFWIALVSVIVGYVVSQVGIIGFIGIIVPHILRRFYGGNTKSLILGSITLGSTILLFSNLIADGSLGFEIPITAITSLIASPIIIYVLVRRNAQEY
ncbi:iron ABC transporter [Candidatus Acidianus copahuensis]|uniref:Iron ABC transporter n=1 Tax=Candidatus Acidianus copahuensis TaxID=1160895 RepID=A0A031LUA2_9CREN|nr:iron ABC transporter permease [Candidatus Acidianus copahuensis]EZQ11049.1 iron ABC transporter [Candidatus Acidianus copahuensis]